MTTNTNLSSIDLNLLVTFDAIMSERNVTRASKRVGRTQPAMSAALQRLRDLFEDELFVRSPKGLEPTPRAMDLSNPISRALSAAQDAVTLVRTFDPLVATDTFRIGIAELPRRRLQVPLALALQKQAPNASLDIRAVHDRRDLIHLLDAGEIDVGVGVNASSSPRMLRQKLFSDHFKCIGRRGHPLLRDDMTVERFAALEHILVSPEGERFGQVDREMASKGLERHLALTLPDMHAVPGIVAASDLVATILESVVQSSELGPKLTIVDPPVDMPSIDFFLHWHRRSDTHQGLTWFRELVAHVAEDF